MKRRSEIGFSSGNDANFTLNLFEQALKHPPSRNVILNLLASQDKSVFELFKGKTFGDVMGTPLKNIKKRDHCESPTALLRRRELEKINRPDSAQSDCSEKSSVSGRSSTLPFEKRLKNVVAYVEIKSGGNDRSAGAKALLKSMGATICENFSRDVTHVVFKDGSYQTYQRAKLLKVHFVSVLWLEAARRNGGKPPENNYPALGTNNYDKNVSLICSQMQKDYEDVIREEIRRTLESGTSVPTTKSLIDNRRRTIASISKRFETSSEFLEDDSPPDIEVKNILQKIRGLSQSEEPKTSSMVLGSVSPVASINNDITELARTIQNQLEKSSDSLQPSLNMECNSDIFTSDSECGMVNGDFSNSKNVVDETFFCVTPLEVKEAGISNMDITCCGDSEDSDSRSLLSNRYISGRKSKNEITKMGSTSLTHATTRNETPKNVLKNVTENQFNSLSYPASKSHMLSDRVSRKTKFKEKENYVIPSAFNCNEIEDGDEFYNLKTPKLSTKKVSKADIISEDNVRNKRDDNSREEVLENQDTVETVMSSLRISDSKEERRPSGDSKRGSTEMSSLRVSSDSKKLSVETSMSSLKLSKSSIEKSVSTNMSSLRISSENHRSKEFSDPQKLDFSQLSKRTEDEEKVISSEKNDIEEMLVSTPFVTERKKKKYHKKSNLCRLGNGDSNPTVNSKLTKIDAQFSTNSSENARSTRRESLALKKEIRKFEMDLKKRKDFHDKNKEIELHFDELNEKTSTTKSTVKELFKTPSKSGIFHSPFVNTRSRRSSVRNIIEDEDAHSDMIRLNQGTSSKQKFARRDQQRLFQLDEEMKDEEQVSDVDHAEKLQQLEKAKQPIEQEIAGNGKSTGNMKVNKDPPLKTPRNKIDNSISDVSKKIDNPSVQGSKKAIVILENIFVSPQNNQEIEDKPNEKSGTETKLKPNEETIPSITIKNKVRKNIDELQDQMAEIKTQPEKKQNFKISKTKSESDVTYEKRRSKRIRRLFNPDDVISDEEINKDIRVNDTEERDIIRQEKIARINGLTQCSTVIGNVLLTQKAKEYLEKNKNNQKEMKTLFRNPESVLDQLGLDQKKKGIKNKKESIVNKSSDEQVELAEEFVHKRLKVHSQPARASQRTPVSRKPYGALSQKSTTTYVRNRRSTLEFQTVSLSEAKVRTKSKLDRRPTIVCTKMHRQDVQMFNQIVKKLGTFEVEDEVSSRTTHLVAGEVKRTINMLRAMARGCWILKQDWLLKSLENRKWLPEEEYEATEFSPAVQKCRLEKSAFGPSYTMNIFLNCGLIYVAKSTTPRCSDLRELITICKGKITRIPDNAVICVGAYFKGHKCVNEYWLLDSVSAGKLKPLKRYLILEETAKSPFV